MRTLSAAVVLAMSVTFCAQAQLAPLPASSVEDGICVQAPGANSGWANTPLANYRVAADNPFTTPLPGGTDAHGILWGSASPGRNGILENGGTYRTVFLGSAGTLGSGVGYCYGASPFDPDAFTLANLSDPMPNLAGFGNHADVSVSVGDAQSFDFWFSTNCGTYTLFAPENGQVDPTVQGSVLWTQTPLLIPTFIPALGQQALVETWIVSISEQNGTAPASAYRIAFQQFAMQGGPLVPIPEPTTYAWCAAALCGVIVLFRRRRLQS